MRAPSGAISKNYFKSDDDLWDLRSCSIVDCNRPDLENENKIIKYIQFNSKGSTRLGSK